MDTMFGMVILWVFCMVYQIALYLLVLTKWIALKSHWRAFARWFSIPLFCDCCFFLIPWAIKGFVQFLLFTCLGQHEILTNCKPSGISPYKTKQNTLSNLSDNRETHSFFYKHTYIFCVYLCYSYRWWLRALYRLQKERYLHVIANTIEHKGVLET